MTTPQRNLQPRTPWEVRYLMDSVQRKLRRERFQAAVRPRRLSVFAINCWGMEIYRDLEIPYQSPFVNLYLELSDFVGFLENFETAIRAPLEFIDEPALSFPVGRIMGKYKIYFMHYQSREEAADKWNRRRERIVPDRDDCYFMVMYLGSPYELNLTRFDQLPFRNKVLFVDHPMPELPNAIVVPPRTGTYQAEDGLTLFRRCQSYFDLPAWLNKEPQPPRALNPGSEKAAP